MKKRILLGSFLGLIAPISTVIACSATPGSRLTEKDKKAIADIDTPEFKKALENQWIDKVIKDEEKDEAKIESKRKEIAEFIIFNELQKNSSYLTELANTLRQSTNNEDEELEIADYIENLGLNDIYYSKPWDKNKTHNGKTAIEWFLDVSNRERIPFYDQVQKTLVVLNYLSLSKTDWEKVFEDEEEGKLSSLEKTLVDSNFPLLKEAINKNYGLKWNTSLTPDKSLGIRLKKEDLTQKYPDNSSASSDPTIEQIILNERNGEINKAQKITNFVPYYGIKSSLFDQGQALSSFKDRVGFQGMETMPSGRGKLDFSLKGWEEHRATKDFVEGYLQKNELVTAEEYKIENNSFDITKILGILPNYDKTTSKISFDETKFDLEELKIIFAIRDEALFDRAVKYFTTKENPISIDLGDQYLNETLDEQGNPYIVETSKRQEKEDKEESDENQQENEEDAPTSE